MKKISTLLLSSLFLFLVVTACQNEQQHTQSEISKQETLVENSSDTEEVNKLIQQYQAYASTYPKDEEGSPRYLYRAAALQYRLNNIEAARSNLENAIRTYYEHENTPNCVLLLGSIYQERLKNSMASSVLYQTAAQAFPSLNTDKNIAAFRDANIEPVDQRLETLSQNMYQDQSGRIDLRLANDFITGCSVYGLLNPQGKQVPELLYKAGETARTVQAFGKAIELYDWIVRDYSNFPKMPQALFLKGFTLDNDLNRKEEARQVYLEFISGFPEDDFADDAKFLLDNLEKTDEEIINSFGQQEAEQ